MAMGRVEFCSTGPNLRDCHARFYCDSCICSDGDCALHGRSGGPAARCALNEGLVHKEFSRSPSRVAEMTGLAGV